LDEQFRKWLDMGKDLSAFAQKTLPPLTQWDSFSDLFSSPEKKPGKEPPVDNKR